MSASPARSTSTLQAARSRRLRDALARSTLVCRYIWALPNTVVGLAIVPFALATRGDVRLVDGVLEVHGWLVSVLLRRGVPLPGGAAAITFGHVVLALDAAALRATRRHERAHVRQCEIWGPAFIPAYLIAGVWACLTGRGAYEGNWFERDAERRC